MHVLIEQEWRKPITMDTFKNYQSIVDYYYNNPHMGGGTSKILENYVRENIGWILFKTRNFYIF